MVLLEQSVFGGIVSGFAGSDTGLQRLVLTLALVMLLTALTCFLVSEITRNYSQVDKLWSIMPAVYSLITLAAYPTPRLFIMSLLVIAWGARLSYNFGRKGGYNIVPWRGEEDYRWKTIQQHRLLKGRFRFALFNLLFISLYQHLLILLFSAPLLIAAKYSGTAVNILDILAASLMLIFLLIETVADNQRHMFLKLKRANKLTAGLFSESLKQGFLSEGLWGIVRHPNFVSEQAIWISFYLFGVAASGLWFNFSLAGPVLLVLLFIGSTSLTESISSKKYPGYASYRNAVPGYFPRFFNGKKQ